MHDCTERVGIPATSLLRARQSQEIALTFDGLTIKFAVIDSEAWRPDHGVLGCTQNHK